MQSKKQDSESFIVPQTFINDHPEMFGEPTEREKLIADLREKVRRAEERGHFDTAHHDMLKQVLGEETIDNAKHDL